jgi:hypothetical protein
VAERKYRRERTDDPRPRLVGDETEPGRTDAAVPATTHTAAREHEVEIIKREAPAVNYVPAVGKKHLGYVFDVDVEAHARRRYRTLPSPDLRASRNVVEAGTPSLASGLLCTRPPLPQAGDGRRGDERVEQATHTFDLTGRHGLSRLTSTKVIQTPVLAVADPHDVVDDPRLPADLADHPTGLHGDHGTHPGDRGDAEEHPGPGRVAPE